MIILKRKLPQWRAWDHPGFGLKSAAAGFLAILPVYLGYRFYFMRVVQGFWFTLLMLISAFILSAALYYFIARVFGIREVSQILKRR